MDDAEADRRVKAAIEALKKEGGLCAFSVKDGFYWNPDKVAKLTPEERKNIGFHERCHLQYAARRMTKETYERALAEIEKFEKGES